MLNWLTRYAAVRPLLDVGPDGALRESVLDVGCGPHGLSVALPRARFAGIDVEFPAPVAENMVAVRSLPGPLPFADAAFETVVCLDVLEHIFAGDRDGFVHELARVAAGRVIVACPSTEGARIDAMLRDAYAARGIPAPGWLDEHDEHGLPTEAHLERCCASVAGFTAAPLAVPNGLLSTLAVVADMLPEFAAEAAAEYGAHREEWLALFEAGRFGGCYRKGWVLERQERLAPLVTAGDLEGGTRRALTRRPAGRDAHGAWDVASPAAVAPAPERSGGAGVVLAPDWSRPREWLPVLGQYIALVPADREVTLHLDSAGGELPFAVVCELITVACERLSEGRPFADVEVLDGGAPTTLTCVEDVAQLRAALGLAVPPERPGPDVAAERAVVAKRLFDDLCQIVERHRFLTAPDPWSDREPLVSVRIPTWNGVDVLLERTIPSVLEGTWRNVEVLVCSDGPDPVARRAVESVPDPRVRYLELGERPRYPSHPWSFWQTAGIHAVNRALDEARGSFIAPLDHDDAFTLDHVASLLEAAANSRADMVYGQALMERREGGWFHVGSMPLRHGQIAHGSALYSSRLGHMRLDADSWILDEPGDWNMWRRISALGASVVHVPHVVLLHHRERSSIESRDDIDDHGLSNGVKPTAADVLADLGSTGAEWLLDVCPPVLAGVP